ncbi:MAG: alpha/beta hydrolase [Terriglobales bacterium]|jgi:pimeloyl-ACP methyl ester carboxylesterase
MGSERVADIHPGITEHTFDAGEVTLNYAEGPANGAPLVLLHGLGRRWQVFLPVIPALSLRWHIFAVDLRGHGKSGRVVRGYHGTQYAEDVARLIRECVPGPAVIFGHSLGGMLAMWVASHHPDLVRALVLGDNMIIARRLGNPMYTALFGGLRDLARKGGSVEQIAAGIGKIVLPVPGTEESVSIRELPGNDEAYLLSWARSVQQADADVYDMTLDGSALESWDGETVLRGIACPTLLLQATPELGGLMSDADVALATRLLAHHAHVRFRNLGHALFIQQPEPVLRAVTNFLESL